MLQISSKHLRLLVQLSLCSPHPVSPIVPPMNVSTQQSFFPEISWHAGVNDTHRALLLPRLIVTLNELATHRIAVVATSSKIVVKKSTVPVCCTAKSTRSVLEVNSKPNARFNIWNSWLRAQSLVISSNRTGFRPVHCRRRRVLVLVHPSLRSMHWGQNPVFQPGTL